jgi:hypothetical protein
MSELYKNLSKKVQKMWKVDSLKASWKESFEILKNDMGILLLVSLRTLTSVYTAIPHSWIFTSISIVAIALAFYAGFSYFAIQFCSFYLILLISATRPSLEEKNSLYWAKYIFVDLLVFCGITSLIVFCVFLYTNIAVWYGFDLLIYSFLASPQLWLPGLDGKEVWAILFSPLLILTILFIRDSQFTPWNFLKAMGRAVLMLINNYPFFLGVYFLFRLILSVGNIISVLLSPYIFVDVIFWALLILLVYPYFICLITNFYVKRLHEQFSLYYPQ